MLSILKKERQRENETFFLVSFLKLDIEKKEFKKEVSRVVAKKKKVVSAGKKVPVNVKVVSVKKKGVSAKTNSAPAKKAPIKELPLFKRVLGDEFLAISAIILFGSFLKLGFGIYSAAITLFIISVFSFVAGASIKSYIKEGC